MKKLNLKYVLLLAGVVLLTLHSCKKDEEECCDPTNPECINYDPCYGSTETTAFFTIAQQYWPAGENADVYIEDDIVTGGELKFSAIPQEGATYTWILGADTIVGDFEITRTLGDLPDGTYENSLIVTKVPDTVCFPLDDGVADFTRSFTRIDGCERAVLGRYIGLFEAQSSDSVIIEVASSPSLNEIEPCDSQSLLGAIHSVNFNLQNDTIRLFLNGYANSRLSFESLGSVGTPTGEFIYDPELDRAIANYHIDEISYSFIGRKIQ